MQFLNNLKLSDIRRIYRILGDARDLRFDGSGQQQCLVDGMAPMLRASYGFAIHFSGLVPGRPVGIERMILGADQDSNILGYLSAWGERFTIDQDPMVKYSLPEPANVVATARSRLLDRKTWSKYSIFEGVVEPGRITDVLIAYYRDCRTGPVFGYSWHRTGTTREFSDHDLALAGFFIQELYVMHAEGLLHPPGDFQCLAPRLQDLCTRLMSGAAQKQIADDMGLAYDSVRTYVKQLYRRLDVQSREELITRMRGRIRASELRSDS